MARAGIDTGGSGAERVRISVNFDTEQGARQIELPFVVGVLADLGGTASKPLAQRAFVEIDRDNFDDVLKRAAPRAGGIAMTCMKDFEPDALLENVPDLRGIIARRAELLELKRRASSDDEVARALGVALQEPSRGDEPDGLLADILGSERDAIADLVREVARHAPSGSKRADQMLAERIEALERDVAAKLDAILHDPEFRSIEGTWRGLRHLVMGSHGKTRVLALSKGELGDRAALRDLIGAELELFGGEPFGLLVADFEWGADDRELLKGLAGVAAAMHAPVVTTASPDAPEETGAYLAGPRFRTRRSYGAKTRKVRTFPYEEDTSAPCWSSAAYAAAERCATSFDRTGWFAAVGGPEHALERVPIDPPIGPTETALSNPSGKPGRVELLVARGTAPCFAATSLSHRLGAERFAHYLKQVAALLNRLGMSDPATMQRGLGAWISDYVAAEGRSASVKRPLTGARLALEENRVRLELQPGYHLHPLQSGPVTLTLHL
ncbi:MAG: type VI secretion system contractile sheath domain-containing protein [Planctomycetota bacterium]|jgi:predicted component of type VI protein secretion system